MFQNNTVELNEIPKYEEVAFTALHKDYVKIVRMNAAITFLIGLSVSIAIYFIVEEIEKYYISGVIFLVGLLLGLYPLLAYKKKKYTFRQHDALYSSGLLFKSTHIVPYIRLQHVVLKQGWLAKRLGLATLELHTAANDNVDVSIPGLTLEEAERWKIFLLNRLQVLDDDTEQ